MQGMNLLDDLTKFENAAFVPVVRTKLEPIKKYCFKDHMGYRWEYSKYSGYKLKKLKRG